MSQKSNKKKNSSPKPENENPLSEPAKDDVKPSEEPESQPQVDEPAEIIPEDNEQSQPSENGEAAAEKEPSLADLFKERLAPMTAAMGKVSGVMKKMGLPGMLLVRFIAVFFFFSAVNVVKMKADNITAVSDWREFVPKVNIGTTFLLMGCAFVIMSVIHLIMPKKYCIQDQVLAIASILYFDFTLLWRANDFNLSLGVMMVSCAFIYYCLGTLRSRKIFDKIPWWVCGIVVLVMSGLVAYFISITTVAKHQNFGTAAHDFGLFVQMYHSLIKDGTAVTSSERDVLMSHFRIHASYIFYTLVPIFKLIPKAETLLVCQALLSMGGVIPLFLIAKRHNMKGISLIFMCLAYAFSIGLVAPCYYEFHENAFLPTLLMWLLWAVDRRNYIVFYIMSILVCIVKEDCPLYVAAISMYMFFEHKGSAKRMHGIIMALLSMGYMLFITDWLTKNGDGQFMMNTRFSILMIDETAGLAEVVKNVIADPAYLFSLLVRDDTRIFFMQVMAPMMFIPFFTKKIRRYLLMIPFIVMNLVIGAGYGYAANVGFQYIFGPVVLLLYMCIINLDDMSRASKHDIPVILGTAAMIMTIGTCSQHIGYVEYNRSNKEYLNSVEDMLDSLPLESSIGTDTFLIPHIADHKHAYIFDGNDIDENGAVINPDKYDFIVIPMLSDQYTYWAETLVNNSFMLCGGIEGRYEIYVNPTSEYVGYGS
ncbi:MAG: DUF2079 domain-containing protein [Ruminococcus sp.]|nr:DUF2079 domain-containing protein [Ruminococcus sp.]